MLEENLIKVFGMLLVYTVTLHPFLLIAREKSEDIMVPFSFRLYSKTNILGKLFIVPILFIIDMVAWVEMALLGIFIFLFNKIFFIGEKEPSVKVA